jgi:hypothetical protein
MSRDELIRRAQERSEGAVAPEGWGEIIELEEDGGAFVGRYLGSALDERWDPARTVYRFLGEDGARGYMPARFRLEQEMGRVTLGDTVAIYRGPDVETRSGNTVHTYGVESEPNQRPLPDAVAPDDDLPF